MRGSRRSESWSESAGDETRVDDGGGIREARVASDCRTGLFVENECSY